MNTIQRYKIILLTLMILLQCTSVKEKNQEFAKFSKIEGENFTFNKSKEKIDTFETQDFYFILTKQEVFIKIVIIGYFIIKDIVVKKKELPIYYVFERGFLIESENRFIFSEIFKNYSNTLEVRSEETIISHNDSDPVKKLVPGLYRIRFSANYKYNYFIKILLFSDNNIIIYRVKPEINEYLKVINTKNVEK